MTTHPGGTYPRYSTGSLPVTSIILVDPVITVLAAITASVHMRAPSTMTARDPMKQLVLNDDRCSLYRLEHTAKAHPAAEMHILSYLGT